MREIRIRKTESMRQNMIIRMKFILGRRVELGSVYNGCHIGSSTIEPDAYMAVSYDPEKRLLMLKKLDEESYLMLTGDVAVWRGELYAEKKFCQFNLAEPVIETIQNYVELHNVEYVTDEVVSAAMRARYPKLPISELNF